MVYSHQQKRSTIRYGSMIAICMAIATGCAGSMGTTARSMLTSVRDSKDPNARYQAYVKLGKPRTYDNTEQMVESIAELSKRLADGKEPAISRAVICRSLGELNRPEARTALLKALDDEDDEVRAEAARAIGKVGQPEDAVLLARMMTIDTTYNGRLAAAEGLSNLKPKDPRIMISLAENLNHDDPAIRLASYRALKQITGADPGSDTDSWHDYLAKNFEGYTADNLVAKKTSKPVGSPSDHAVLPAGLPGATGQIPFMPGQAPSVPASGVVKP
ncbi:MAG: HEAT repeat domain-containing protein [Planctomycetota bacterium]|nr:HEAT repeat domain-containing protein [Planctomycetota bacterium]RLT15096.1 MAG: HEAT repeat domain-containing protein [Planctomycetota bacterium]